MRDQSIVDSRLRTQSSLDRRTSSKSKSDSSEPPLNSSEDHSSMKLHQSILVGESTCWPSFFFCTSKDHAQLLIMHACIQNGNGTAGMNGATASECDGTERKRHRFFLLQLYMQKISIDITCVGLASACPKYQIAVLVGGSAQLSKTKPNVVLVSTIDTIFSRY